MELNNEICMHIANHLEIESMSALVYNHIRNIDV